MLDDPFAQGTAYGLKAQLDEAGFETVAEEVYPPDQTDFAAIAATVADADADLFVGGTQFEDSIGLIRAFQERCGDVVSRWDGHVAKYMGDGVVAYFGWPQAHEDDAVLASIALLADVQVATLELHDRLRSLGCPRRPLSLLADALSDVLADALELVGVTMPYPPASLVLAWARRRRFARLPEPLRTQLGPLAFVLDVELTPERRLAREDPQVIRENLDLRGFHLQFPPSIAGDPLHEDMFGKGWGTDA